MSGHSKWHNIQGRKNAQDAKRGKIFQKISRDLYQAAKAGDPDPENNPQLRLVMEKARAANMPKDNVQRAIDKASGLGGAKFEEITYEGYGPGGTAIMVSALTDNKNRTAAAIRSAFTHHGGSLGASGSVSYMFDRKGYIEVLRDGLDKSEDDMLMDALDAGADDMKTTDSEFQIFTDPSSLAAVRDELQKKGYDLDTAEVRMFPETTTEVPGDKISQYSGLIDELENNDDVQDVYEAAVLPENS
ncbi:MAG: YebC/PmpR family DNA-binding transcriptional regulator [Lentilactobacillus hilgardii]|jgi:YebC/PmpR family DNA-binding regulatory protein|uniref:Probable transcriptional regulatory protein GQR93_07005 n=2 Tax=Lentilactobacillus hilgardii TaxID=1588 RepID=A0A6P1E5U9_LENHI|nr:YebC/PmpR family DNA-binding transcriptional regulator [Lentilactobacillus hilgardii]RRG11356.1 MAG: YebC/PmpR family DNA-binding transcriptional regulator [Lactobacillus sp.]EEI69934.1 DNA-binding regulatory protein, YebC/PmpR family [Lentilactobacillus hilgardii ATCC 27305]MBZ2201446.1 YebC/PmpR family DNA-binding transcriptional regulator [Lentilactobacillus hilgardii]MBZ2204361.1 YebC/PmpR family DNA-binding transcriptional regulator [Lentilactobacillus hilgardii]MCT3391954.1 YebC/PmpR 